LKCPLDLSKRRTTIAPVLRSDRSNGQNGRTVPNTDAGSHLLQASDKSVNGTPIDSDGGGPSTHIDINNEKSTFWAVIFIVTLIVVTVASVATIGSISRNRSKRPKGTVVYQK